MPRYQMCTKIEQYCRVAFLRYGPTFNPVLRDIQVWISAGCWMAEPLRGFTLQELFKEIVRAVGYADWIRHADVMH